jgi:hypothetical protein
VILDICAFRPICLSPFWVSGVALDMRRIGCLFIRLTHNHHRCLHAEQTGQLCGLCSIEVTAGKSRLSVCSCDNAPNIEIYAAYTVSVKLRHSSSTSSDIISVAVNFLEIAKPAP